MGWEESENYSGGKMMFSTHSREEIIRKYQELEKELEKLRNEKEALGRELRKYKNPNTPPSAHPPSPVLSCADSSNRVHPTLSF